MWSLPWLSVSLVAVVLVGAVLGGIVLRRFGVRAATVCLKAMAAAVFAGLSIAGALQIYAFVRPAYDVLFLQPDEDLGWKQVPNLRWIWAGLHWHAVDFTTPVQTNSLGFRDLDRPWDKPEATVRVALLGASMVEAAQVPLEKTAAQVLERKLNAGPRGKIQGPRRFEVLNFGISNYSVGQFLLAWEEYASRFQPDYVFLFISRPNLEKTIESYESRSFVGTDRRLRVRPTFRLENESLLREPASDYPAFVEAQQTLLREEFNGKRIRRRTQSVLQLMVKELHLVWLRSKRRLARELGRAPVRPAAGFSVSSEAMDVNREVIRELARQVRRQGGRLALVDSVRYEDPQDRELARISAAVKELCRKQAYGYVDLSEELQKANMRGVQTSWRIDPHFNEAGNEIFADAMLVWLTGQISAGSATGE